MATVSSDESFNICQINPLESISIIKKQQQKGFFTKAFKELLTNKWMGKENVKQCLDLDLPNFIANNLENVIYSVTFIKLYDNQLQHQVIFF